MNKKSIQELIARHNEISMRMNAIADAMEAEKREMNDAEKAEVALLKREQGIIDLQLRSQAMPLVGNGSKSVAVIFDEFLREVKDNKGGEYTFQRTSVTTAVTTATTNANGMIPVAIDEILKPLEEGLVLGQLGIKVKTGVIGSFIVPSIAAVEATVAGEAETISDASIEFGKITPSPVRVSITIPVSNQLINQTAGKAYQAIVEQLNAGITRTLNKRLLSTDTSLSKFFGGFKACAAATGKTIAQLKTLADKKACYKITFAGAVPTYKELVMMKSVAAVKGCENLFPAYVMDAAMYGELESTPKDAGSGRMIIEDGKINGVPVLQSNYIDNGNTTQIGFAYFGYQALNGFGDARMIVDPYSLASSDCTRVTINTDWDMMALRPEGFVLGVCATVQG